ncbi:hypothetical protein E4U42_004436 [Claviceps africana]|uniref:Cytochrome P450 n=1 Tax=Claviceps africana TaxID=83212 RepID=A0A8K0JE86_9HYPO|nr:hypothetical protein E4U42_004436 [Claviceps africana]
MELFGADDLRFAWSWTTVVTFFLAAAYAFDFGSKAYRDYALRSFGSPAKLIPFLAPFGIDIGLYSLYRFFTDTYFELMTRWLESSPGRTIEIRMFSQGLICTDEPDNIKAIMSTKWSSFGKGEVTRRIWANMIGQRQIFAIDGDYWHKAKELLRPHIGSSRPDDLIRTERHVEQLFKRLSGSEAVEVYDLIDRFQLDVTTDIFFGESANSLSSTPPFRSAMDKLLPINTARMIFGEKAFYLPDTLLAPAALRALKDYTDSITDRAYARDLSKKRPEDYTLLDDLVSQKKSYEEIKEALMSVMLGGKDPSSILITWVILMMGTHPHVMMKMQAEVNEVCGTKPPTASQLKEMTYVRHVINETFRLYHPLGLNVRVALNDVTLPTGGGRSGREPLAIAKGSSIIYSLMGMQRRKDIFGEDAGEFRPERWEEKSIHRWHFIPYNHGPRMCMGRNFGQQQVEYVLARICQRFQDIRIPKGQRQQQIRVELNCKMAHPCMCEFVQKQ